MSNKQEIFNKYQNSKPANIQAAARTLDQVHADFLLFVKGYKPLNASDIDTSDITGSADQLSFYRLALSTLLHTVYGQFEQPMYGSANSQMFKLRRDGGTFRLESYGILPGRGTVEISDAKISMTENSLSLTSNNGNSITIERTGEKFNVNQFVANAPAVIVPIFQLSILKNGALASRFHLVDLTM